MMQFEGSDTITEKDMKILWKEFTSGKWDDKLNIKLGEWSRDFHGYRFVYFNNHRIGSVSKEHFITSYKRSINYADDNTLGYKTNAKLLAIYYMLDLLKVYGQDKEIYSKTFYKRTSRADDWEEILKENNLEDEIIQGSIDGK